MARHTTFRVGGPARRMAFPAAPEELAALLALAAEEGWPWLAAGNGFNLLADDGGLDMLVIAPPAQMPAKLSPGMVFLPMPLKRNELIDTMEMMARAQQRRRRRLRNRPKTRSQADQELLCSAKELLMERNHMTEEEAHHYLQKCSMDNGSNLVETAQMVISLGQG